MNHKKSIQLAKKCIKKMPMPNGLERKFRENGLEHLLDGVYRRTAELVRENENADKAVWEHLEQILPCIAFYEVLVEEMGSKEQALLCYEKWCFAMIEKMAKMIPVVMKIPGLYKKIPSIMRKLLDAKFGHAAGFDYVERECKNGFAVDMIRCPYVKTCEKYSCPELTQFFCKSDDITYGNMHPKLIWDRSKTLGTDGDCCDFKLYIKD